MFFSPLNNFSLTWHWGSILYENVLVIKKLLGKISSTAKYRWANKEDEEEKQDKEEEN